MVDGKGRKREKRRKKGREEEGFKVFSYLINPLSCLYTQTLLIKHECKNLYSFFFLSYI